MTYHQDQSQVRSGNSPQVMATLSNMAISLLRLTGWANIAVPCDTTPEDPTDPSSWY